MSYIEESISDVSVCLYVCVSVDVCVPAMCVCACVCVEGGKGYRQKGIRSFLRTYHDKTIVQSYDNTLISSMLR